MTPLSDARLADLGALLVFRYLMQQQLQEMAGLNDQELYPFRPAREQPPERRYSRLFF